jgi:hypothetical protein
LPCFADANMCFKKKPTLPPEPPSDPVEPPVIETPTTLPYPEEPMNSNATVDSINLDAVFDDWLIKYQVPEIWYSYWRNQIEIKVFDEWPPEILAWGISPTTPAFAYEQNGKRLLYSLAAWFNPGVIAHEQAHNSHALLTSSQKADFKVKLAYAEANDPYVILLKKLKPVNWGDYAIEQHAEIYRYLCDKMPEYLKCFYPKLF